MSERTVSVKLMARIAEYQSAMREAAKATKSVSDSGTVDMKKLGGQMIDVGQKATAGITLPLLGAGAAAVSLSNDFNSTFGQMAGLAGVPAAEIDGLKQSVLELAGETARAPQELAEALYFAASAGLDSAQAMNAVDVAARAASAGLGSTVDVVGLAASAVASYGAENITAAEATDILVSTIREGRAEPAELAGTLGRVLPIAAQLGVSFAEVGGAVAVLSNVFGDTNRTVTATQGLLVKLLSPTQQGRDALADMGTSVEDLHAAIDSDGLLGALELLRSKGFDTNATALRALFDDIEGFQAASALLAADQTTLAETFGATANAAGSLDTAVGALDGNAQKMKQSWVDIQVALIQVGEVIGPIVADIAGGVGSLAGEFADLDPTVQKIVIGIAGFAAAAGPTLIVLGSLVRNYKELKAAMSFAGGSKLAGSLGAVTGALTIAVGVYALYASEKQKATARTNEFVTALKAEADGQRAATDELLIGVFSQDKYALALAELGISVADVVRAVKGEYVPALDDLTGRASQAAFAGNGKLMKSFLDLSVGIDQQSTAMKSAAEIYGRQTTATEELARRTDMYTEFAARMRAELEAQPPVVERQTSALDSSSIALDALAGGASSAAVTVDQLSRAADRLAGEISDLESTYDKLTDRLSDRNTYLGLVEQMDEVNAAATAAFDAMANGHEDAAALASTHEQTLNSFKLDVMDFATEVEGLPAQRVTEVLAEIEDASYERTVEILNWLETTRRVTLLIDPTLTSAMPTTESGRVRGGRARGGPVAAGSMYEVLEGGKSELLTEGGRTFLMAAKNGHVTPLSGQGVMSGGGSSMYVIDQRATHHHYHHNNVTVQAARSYR